MISSTTAMSIHAVMNNFNVALLALLQLKYQNKEISPLEEHGTIMLLYILTCLFYSIAFIALMLQARQLPETPCLATSPPPAVLLPAHHQLPETPCLAALKHISLLAGALACGLLLLILFPPFGYFVLAFCGVLVLVKALLLSYQQIMGQSMGGVPSNHNSTDQGSGDHNTAPIANV